MLLDQLHRISHYQNAEVFERIAVAVGDLKRLYEDGSPDQSAKDEAIAAGGLVIDAQALEVFWEGQLVKADWRRFSRVWGFLLALARKAAHRRDVTESDSYDDAVARTAMARNKERLQTLVPPSLRRHMGRHRHHDR